MQARGGLRMLPIEDMAQLGRLTCADIAHADVVVVASPLLRRRNAAIVSASRRHVTSCRHEPSRGRHVVTSFPGGTDRLSFYYAMRRIPHLLHDDHHHGDVDVVK